MAHIILKFPYYSIFSLVRERVKICFIISNVSMANIMLCGRQHVTIELQIEWVCINPLVPKFDYRQHAVCS